MSIAFEAGLTWTWLNNAAEKGETHNQIINNISISAPPKWAIYANVLEEIGESEVPENVGENGTSDLLNT